MQCMRRSIQPVFLNEHMPQHMRWRYASCEASLLERSSSCIAPLLTSDLHTLHAPCTTTNCQTHAWAGSKMVHMLHQDSIHGAGTQGMGALNKMGASRIGSTSRGGRHSHPRTCCACHTAHGSKLGAWLPFHRCTPSGCRLRPLLTFTTCAASLHTPCSHPAAAQDAAGHIIDNNIPTSPAARPLPLCCAAVVASSALLLLLLLLTTCQISQVAATLNIRAGGPPVKVDRFFFNCVSGRMRWLTIAHAYMPCLFLHASCMCSLTSLHNELWMIPFLHHHCLLMMHVRQRLQQLQVWHACHCCAVLHVFD